MVVDNQSIEPAENVLALFLRKTVDLLGMMAYSKNTLPARNRVGADDGMDRLQIISDVLWSTSWCGVQFEIVLLRALIKDGLCVGSGQAFQELLVRLRDTVVDFVSGCPERICNLSFSGMVNYEN